MNTFHINPFSQLSSRVAPLVEDILNERGDDVLIAIRGEFILTDEETGAGYDTPYCVTEAPQDCTEAGGRTEYMWGYVSAKKWLAQYKAQSEL